MAKKVVPLDRKVQAVIDVVSGNLSLEASAVKHNVSLSALYVWRNLFFENVEQMLQPRKPGPEAKTPSIKLVLGLTHIIEMQDAEINRLQKMLAQEKAVKDNDHPRPEQSVRRFFPQVGVEWFTRNGKRLSLSFGKFLELGLRLLAAPLLRVWNAYNDRQRDLFDTEIDVNAPADNCPHCGHRRIWKNGSYHVINYVFKFLFRFLPRGTEKVYIQRYICAQCKRPVHSFLKVVNAYCREQFHQQIIRALAYGKFYLGLSLRQLQSCGEWFFQHGLSLRAIAQHLDRIGQRAAIIIEGLSTLPQKTAHLLMLDEMFIKIKKTTAYLCLAMDENGLIRGVRLLASRRAEDLKSLIGQTVGPCFRPVKVLTDFWRGYDEAVTAVLGEACRHYHDFVHAIRICFRCVDEAVRKTKLLGTSKKLSRKDFDNLKQLKKRLIRGQLLRVMKELLAVWTPLTQTAPLASARLTTFLAVYKERLALVENVLAKLDKIPGAGARHFKKAIDKFFKKYLAEFVELLLDAKEAADCGQRMPITTNALESKNSIFKPLIKIIKSFRRLKNAENLFCGAALFQDFRVDTRGKNKGTSAIQRTELQIQAKDFFDAVGLKMVYEV